MTSKTHTNSQILIDTNELIFFVTDQIRESIFFFIVGRSVDETIRLVKAFQFVEKHGEVCPANWSENSPTIKPNPEGSLEYFEKVNEQLCANVV